MDFRKPGVHKLLSYYVVGAIIHPVVWDWMVQLLWDEVT